MDVLPRLCERRWPNVVRGQPSWARLGWFMFSYESYKLHALYFGTSQNLEMPLRASKKLRSEVEKFKIIETLRIVRHQEATKPDPYRD